jgi:catechol 2,3-dioxygenase-like lactoylglutathione lyase family enzyme
MNIDGLDSVILYVESLEKAKKFYVDTLGLPFAGHREHGTPLDRGCDHLDASSLPGVAVVRLATSHFFARSGLRAALMTLER